MNILRLIVTIVFFAIAAIDFGIYVCCGWPPLCDRLFYVDVVLWVFLLFASLPTNPVAHNEGPYGKVESEK